MKLKNQSNKLFGLSLVLVMLFPVNINANIVNVQYFDYLIQNGTFENGVTGWQTLAGNFEYSTANARHGSASARLSHSYSYAEAKYTLDPSDMVGNTLEFTVWFDSYDDNLEIRIHYRTEICEFIGYQLICDDFWDYTTSGWVEQSSLSGEQAWKQVSVSKYIDSHITQVYVTVKAQDTTYPTTTITYIDDVTATVGDTDVRGIRVDGNGEFTYSVTGQIYKTEPYGAGYQNIIEMNVGFAVEDRDPTDIYYINSVTIYVYKNGGSSAGTLQALNWQYWAESSHVRQVTGSPGPSYTLSGVTRAASTIGIVTGGAIGTTAGGLAFLLGSASLLMQMSKSGGRDSAGTGDSYIYAQWFPQIGYSYLLGDIGGGYDFHFIYDPDDGYSDTLKISMKVGYRRCPSTCEPVVYSTEDLYIYV